MSDRGRHLRRSGLGFYRDLLLLAAGILIVGAIVFGGLSLLAGDAPSEAATGQTSTTDAGVTTTTSTSTSTTSSTTTTMPSTSVSSSTTSVETTPTTIREVRGPTEVRVVVLNSTDVAGSAAELTDQLAPLGYQLIEPDNYTPELSDSMIFHADDFALEAVRLAEAVPGATPAPDPELAAAWNVDLVVVIGRSHVE